MRPSANFFSCFNNRGACDHNHPHHDMYVPCWLLSSLLSMKVHAWTTLAHACLDCQSLALPPSTIPTPRTYLSSYSACVTQFQSTLFNHYVLSLCPCQQCHLIWDCRWVVIVSLAAGTSHTLTRTDAIANLSACPKPTATGVVVSPKVYSPSASSHYSFMLLTNYVLQTHA